MENDYANSSPHNMEQFSNIMTPGSKMRGNEMPIQSMRMNSLPPMSLVNYTTSLRNNASKQRDDYQKLYDFYDINVDAHETHSQ
jgi:hypothetical protein